ncbi:fluoride efflux transporter FluC [Arthrobacter sp. Hor0625]|uniref:fluoride efflux transporter FluC n=1 Tax=Arthrobacter sp. Hor0625 TaxID=3457358 RepID=UPI00403E812E
MERRTPETAAPNTSAESPAAGPGRVLPVNGDAGTLGPARVQRPLHLHPGFVLVVVCGGVAGALARYGLGTVLPSPGGWPLPTFVVNLAGAFLLGALLEALVRRGPDGGRLRVIRLLAGTGFMGAFTTYSSLALETTTLLGAGRAGDALGYVAATVVGGALATVAGIRAAAGQHDRQARRRSPGRAARQGRTE